MKRAMEPFKKAPVAAAVIAAVLLVSGLANAQSSGNGISNLFGNMFSGQKSATPAPSSPGTAGSAALPWSGEDGASGHPLMTASAIRQAAANFDTRVASMCPRAARRNIREENFQRFPAGLQPDLRIMDLMDWQPELPKSIWDCPGILVNGSRLAKG